MSTKDPNALGSQDTLAVDSAELAKSVAPAPRIGGRYEVLALVGSGAMGSVYRARDVELDEIVALKFLRSELVDSPAMLDRFRREVKLARRVTHPNVARVYDIGEHEREKFLSMELISGEPLSALLEREGALPLSRALALVAPICEGLAAAHAVGVVHRDLKPDNVLIASDGRVVISDFGIARSALGGPEGATLGVVVGTPAYMAPEQVECAPNIDQRADLYALGAMLFEMLTGQLPWQGGSAITVAAARLARPAPNPRDVRADLDERVASAILRCMARRPEDRFQSALELLAALAEAAPSAEQTAVREKPCASETPATGDKTVAVLPFKNLGAPEDAYVAEGLTEDLADTLSMARGLRVRPQSAVARHLTAQADPIELGRALGVQVVVEGSVRRRGDTLRVSARLVSVAEGFQLWARRFDRSASDVLVVSDEVADAVAEALTLAPTSQHRAPPTDPEAIDLYLRARAAFRALNQRALRQALELLEQAHARAPDDATILSAYARVATRLWFFGDKSMAADAVRELTERAVRVAPERGEALLALAQIRFACGEARVAAELAARAVARAPLLPETHELVGRILLETGPMDVGVASLERAHALDPLAEAPIGELVRARALQGDFDGAYALLLEHPPAAGVVTRAALIARCALWSRSAEPWFGLLPPLDDADKMSAAPAAIAMRTVFERGQVHPAHDATMCELLADRSRPARFVSLISQIATEIHAFAGDLDTAIERLRAGVDAGLLDLVWMDHCPVLAQLREDPRFGELRSAVEARALAARAALVGGRAAA